MLMQKGLDAIQVNVDFDKKHWNLLTDQLIETALHNKVKFKVVSNKNTNGLTTTLIKGNEKLQVSVLQYYKSKWISYRFKGGINIVSFDEATLLLGEYSFLNSIRDHRIKRLELAIDYVGLHTTQFISHYLGVKKSHIHSNNQCNGFTQYSGSKDGKTQLVVYDKAQEILDKGGVPLFPKLMRIELRIQNRQSSFLNFILNALSNDPFSKVLLVNKSAALKHNTALKAWPLFLSCCSSVGVAQALQQFKPHKKTFLQALKTPSFQSRIPSMADFEKPFMQMLSEIYPDGFVINENLLKNL